MITNPSAHGKKKNLYLAPSLEFT